MSKSKSTLITVAAGTLLAAAARVFMISQTDMTTGFIVHGKEILCSILYYGVILLTAVVCAVIQIKDNSFDVSKLEGRYALPIGFGLLAVALAAGYDGMSESSSLLPSGFTILVNFGFAAVLCILAFITLYLKEFKPWLGFLYALGGIFFAARGICIFNERMVVSAVCEYLIDTLIVICGAVFMLMLARVLSGNSGKLTAAAFFGWGAGCAALTFSAYIGAGVAKLFFPSEISDRIVFSSNSAEIFYQGVHGVDAYHMAFPPLADLSVGIIAAAAMTAVCLSRKADA